MASQRVLLLIIGGPLADAVWQDICRWSDARVTTATNQWSHEDWPIEVREEVDAFVRKIIASAFMPPVLYRSEHVDCWSMGDVFNEALMKRHPDYSRCLFTSNHEVIATWVQDCEQVVVAANTPDETRWLYNRINEAVTAWQGFTEDRLLILVRRILGGLLTDDEVTEALAEMPSWWRKTASGSNGESDTSSAAE